MSPFDKVREFHTTFNAATDLPIENADSSLLNLRLGLVFEEAYEIEEELQDVLGVSLDSFEINKMALTKELADLLYVTIGFAVTFGLPLEEVFNEVHKSNMSKLGEDGKPILREDGKVLKGPNYAPPNLERFFK